MARKQDCGCDFVDEEAVKREAMISLHEVKAAKIWLKPSILRRETPRTVIQPAKRSRQQHIQTVHFELGQPLPTISLPVSFCSTSDLDPNLFLTSNSAASQNTPPTESCFGK